MSNQNDELCPYCGMPKYEEGVRNCCERGAREEAGSDEDFAAATLNRYAHLFFTIDNALSKSKSKRPRPPKRIIPPAKCIKIDCDAVVEDGGYRKLGACCRAHASYLCGQCNRPHSYSSKIGLDHFRFRVDDWRGFGIHGEPLARWALREVE